TPSALGLARGCRARDTLPTRPRPRRSRGPGTSSLGRVSGRPPHYPGLARLSPPPVTRTSAPPTPPPGSSAPLARAPSGPWPEDVIRRVLRRLLASAAARPHPWLA